MKIKSVKITGFRAFEKEENSTFDFTKGGEIMNFASIYAPNGFGKTSFYDAVEWGITHKIQRFDRMVDFEKVRKDNNAPLLLNKASLSGKVIVETSSKNFENTINKKKVYKYNERPINEYFQSQILTQDLIDTFLKEEKADKRYENFLEIDDDLKKYDAIYKKINRLLEYIKDERKELGNKLGKEEEKLQGEIDFDQEFKKFDEINEAISSLNRENEDLQLVNQSIFNQTSYDNLSRNVEIRLFSLEEELMKAKSFIDEIILARDGKETEDNKIEGGILSYIENKNKVLKLDEQLIELDQIIKWFEDQEKINNDLNLNSENLKTEQNRLEKIISIEKKFETFIGIQKEIENLQKDITDSNNKLLDVEREKLDSEKEKNNETIKLNELKTSLEKNQATLNNIPTQKQQLEVTSKSIVDTQKSIDDLSKSITTEEKKLKDLEETINQFIYYENQINGDIELLLEFDLFKEHQNLVSSYIDGFKKTDDLKSNLKDLQNKIDNQSSFNNELKDFINTGLEIVNKSQSPDCPLCNHTYESFEKLSENILSNELFDIQLKKYLEAKNNTETELNNLSSKLSENKEEITNAFSSLKQPFLSERKNIENTINKLVSERTAMLDNLGKAQLSLQELQLFFGEQTPDKFTEKLQEDISTIQQQITKITDLCNTIDSKISDNNTLLKKHTENLQSFESNLKKFQGSKDYEEVRQFFVNELDSNNFEKTILLDHKSLVQKIIGDLIKEKNDLTNKLGDLKTKLSNYSLAKEDYIKKNQEVNQEKNLIQRAYESYEKQIQSEFKIQIFDKDKSQIEKEFLDLIEKQKAFEKLLETKTEKFKIVKILNEACIKATESKKVKDSIEEIKKSIEELDKAEGKLITEKGSLKTYLKKTIEAYFYTPLINAIYRKIDPHPDYKSIEFECDFAENKPRLQIYTVSDKSVRSVPSLYFSTAQINILSLSIFLARALKTRDDKKEPVDCIFIDDPIQSMDSINILSFIDLFRGITMSLDKQLIVSTHEENFHLLLQKKIPSDLFKSKFLEFETFGKVKTN